MQKETLYIVSTPIGNLGDITFRAIEALKTSDIIVCEDTRITRKLLKHYNISAKKLLSYAKHNLKKRTQDIITALQNNQSVTLVSDAGTPTISDPGELLITECYKYNFKVVPIPGVSAVITALSVSGLPAQPFYFGGFLPEKSGLRYQVLLGLKSLPATLIFFETKHRLLKSLQDIKIIFGDETIVALARELTKLYEEIRTDTINNLLNNLDPAKLLGEFVLLINNRFHNQTFSLQEVKSALSEQLKTLSVKDSSTIIAKQFNLPKKDVYSLALELKLKPDARKNHE